MILVPQAFVLALGLMAFASSAFADQPPYARIRSLTYAGSGCPAGSVAGRIESRLDSFTLLFDQYLAEVGPGVPIMQKRKNCQINLDIDHPAGWSYAVLTIDYRGYVALERGVRAQQSAKYYFQGAGSTATLTTTMTGPLDRDYQIRDTLGLNAVVWSPCGARRALNINSQVLLDNAAAPGRHGLITTESIGPFSARYGLQWTRCR